MTSELKRCLSLTEIVVYGVGLILGAGIYVLIGAAAGIAGNMLWLSFILAAIVAGFTALSYAELSALFPQASAEYVYVKAAFGREAIAWIFGLIAIVIGFSTTSAVAVGFARYLAVFVSLDQTFMAAGLIVVMSLVNYWGIKESARFNTLATGIEISGLLLVIFVGGYLIFDNQIQLANLGELPITDQPGSLPWLPIVSAGALIFFAYMGFEDIANIAEEAKNPAQTLPRAFIYALLISTVIYVLVAIVAVSVIPYAELARADQPLSEVMSFLIGGRAPEIMAVIALFATANTVLITLIVGARMMYGMAKSNSLPAIFARVHHIRQTPYFAVIFMALISIAFLMFEEIEVLASITDVGIFILFFIVNLSHIVLRFRRPELDRPWRTPINIGRLPIIPLLGVISCALMLATINHPVNIAGQQYSSLLVGLSIFSLAIPLYFLFKQLNAESDK